jgi:hypothetical protein
MIDMAGIARLELAVDLSSLAQNSDATNRLLG